MLSKNNKKQYDLKHANGRQHFSLRKTTLGLASVLLSTTLYLGGNSGQLVHAAEDTNSTTVSSNADAISTEEAKTTSVDKSALQKLMTMHLMFKNQMLNTLTKLTLLKRVHMIVQLLMQNLF